ncbi:putative protein kinase RLK-Pelle-DLSV family [Arabidopsis thaliana]
MTKLSDFPGDLLEEILSRVPVTSSRAVRSTCIKWNTLSKNESFTKNHIAQVSSSASLFDERQYPWTSQRLEVIDFTAERFGPRLPLPFESSCEDTVTLSSVREEQLEVFFENCYTLEMEIGVTTKIEPNAISWSKFLAVDMDPLTGFQFYSGGSFLIHEEKRAVVVFDEDKNVSKTSRNTAYFIGVNGNFREKWISEKLQQSERFSRMPSLMFQVLCFLSLDLMRNVKNFLTFGINFTCFPIRFQDSFPLAPAMLEDFPFVVIVSITFLVNFCVTAVARKLQRTRLQICPPALLTWTSELDLTITRYVFLKNTFERYLIPNYHLPSFRKSEIMWSNCIFLTLFTLYLFLGQSCCETDTLLQGQYLKDGQELVSTFNIFKVKFFNFENSSNWYLGIWYNNFYLSGGNKKYGDIKDKAVWIANRNNPVLGRSGSLTVDSLGRLRILRGASSLLELSSTETTGNTTLKLLDSGNLQLQEMDSDGSMMRILWQSFDYPTDTLLPGMKLGFNVKNGKRWELTSWLGDTLPAPGSLVFGMDANITNRLTILWRGNMYWASGLWFKGGFSLEELNDYGFLFSFISTESEHYFMYSGDQKYAGTFFPAIMIDQQGILRIYRLDRERLYVHCSPFTLDEDSNFNCYRRNSRDCLHAGCIVPERQNESFYGFRFFRETVSAFSSNGFVLNETGGRFSSADCRAICMQNASCLAYASTNLDGTGCEIWNIDPTDKRSSPQSPRTIYIRVKGFVVNHENEKAATWLVVVASLFLMIPVTWFIIYLVLMKFKVKVTVIFRGMFYFLWGKAIPQMIGFIRRRLPTLRVGSTIDQEMLLRELGIDRRRRGKRSARKNNNELQIFSFESVALATDYFSDANKLGEGGFGPVYKGSLIDGEEVAIKRLSLASGQGLVEFKNEAMLIAKLQHTNLVQLLGCCIEKDEKMLIYEYMPNKSLDYFLFDPLRKNVLDWTLRFRIMEGIIQGLLYLHKYSRLKVIHRDIKASNILLDEDMNPKISDFGMARIFGAQESKANTKRVAGTFGYMSPEYFREGLFSTKSDVFSFGVLMLEIICGRKNNSFHHDSEGPLNLIVHVWNLFKENHVREVIDPSLGDSAVENPQVLRCVQVALLCVQQNADDRPSMLDVVSMIYGDGNNALSLPKEPAFYDGPRRSLQEMEVEPPELENVSANRVTITVMEAR